MCQYSQKHNEKEMLPVTTYQPCFPAMPFIFAIAAASSPPKDPASAAAEKKMAARMPNSSLLYQPI